MRLKLDGRTRALVGRLPTINVYSLAELILIAGLATQAARLVWTIATPVAPLGDWRPAEPQVPGSVRDILSGFDPFFRLGGETAGPAQVTSLQLQLFGVRLNEATGRGNAIIAGPDGVQKSIEVGEEIVPGVKLQAVAFDHVTLDRGGTAEDLYLDQSGASPAPVAPGAAPAAPPGLVAPPPAAPPGAVSAQQLRSEIGFTPRIDGGRLSGLVVRPQGSGGAFRAAGLQEGDVVTAIGGRPVTSPADIDRAVQEFATGGTVPMTVERGGQPMPLSVQVAPK